MSIQPWLRTAAVAGLTTIAATLLPSPAPLRAQTSATAPATAPTRPRILDDSGQVVSECLWPAGQRQIVLKLTHAGEFWLTHDVKINGQDIGWMLIDTGANITTIDTSLASDFHLPNLKLIPGTDYAACRAVDELRAGDLRLRNHFVYTGDFAPVRTIAGVRIMGSLGGDVFSQQPFCLDLAAGTLTFFDRAQFTPPPGARAEKLSLAGRGTSGSAYSRANPFAGNPMVNVLLDAIECPMVLDTGANSALSLYPALCRRHRELVDWDGGVRTQKAVLGGWVNEYGVKARAAVIFGRKTNIDADTLAQIEDGPVAPPQEDGVVGSHTLENFRLTFDYAAGRLWTEYQPRKSVAERLAAGLDPNARDPGDWTPLIEAAIRGDAEGVRALLKAGARPDAVTATGMSTIRAATEGGNIEVLRALLAVDGLDVNAKSAAGLTALMSSLGQPSEVEMIQLLTARGANLSLVSSEGFTALEYAAMMGRVAGFEALWRAGARPQAKPKDGATLLHFAARDFTGNMVRHLLKGAEGTFVLDARLNNGATPLMMAAEKGRLEALRALLDAGASVNLAAEGNGGVTALHAAADGGFVDIIDLLLQHKATVDARSTHGETPLQFAAEKGYLPAVETLLKHGADANAANQIGLTALMAASADGHSAIVETLLQHGADVKAATAQGGTALHAAAQNGQLAIVRTLIKAGAPLDARLSDQRLTPLDLAQRSGHTEVANLLRQPATSQPAP